MVVKKETMVRYVFTVLLCGALLFMLSIPLYAANGNEVTHLSQEEFMQKRSQQSNAQVIIDVRTNEEYRGGYIEGAINISHTDIINNISLLDPYKGKDIVFYCHSGARVKRVTDYLQDISYAPNKLYHLKGDISAWRASNLPLQQ